MPLMATVYFDTKPFIQSYNTAQKNKISSEFKKIDKNQFEKLE